MKRRNFLSGLLAAPLALKARLPLLARFFAPKPVYEPITPRQLQMARQFAKLLAETEQKGRAMRRGLEPAD